MVKFVDGTTEAHWAESSETFILIWLPLGSMA